MKEQKSSYFWLFEQRNSPRFQARITDVLLEGVPKIRGQIWLRTVIEMNTIDLNRIKQGPVIIVNLQMKHLERFRFQINFLPDSL